MRRALNPGYAGIEVPRDLHQPLGRRQGQAKEAGLFQQIGKLQMELEWLKKKSQLL